MTPSIGDIISFDYTTQSIKQPYYGIISKFENNNEIAHIIWFDEQAYEIYGARITTWSYGNFWRVVKNVP
jgi:hypothetical protein